MNERASCNGVLLAVVLLQVILTSKTVSVSRAVLNRALVSTHVAVRGLHMAVQFVSASKRSAVAAARIVTKQGQAMNVANVRIQSTLALEDGLGFAPRFLTAKLPWPHCGHSHCGPGQNNNSPERPFSSHPPDRHRLAHPLGQSDLLRLQRPGLLLLAARLRPREEQDVYPDHGYRRPAQIREGQRDAGYCKG
jgi:hypothetical protein